VNLFLDTSVLLAASGSANGASREVFRYAQINGWTLLASPYVLGEIARNISLFPPQAAMDWAQLRGNLTIVDDILTLDRINVFPITKDRPILFTAFAWASVLLTLDRGDFGELLGGNFYGLEIMPPADFLFSRRLHGELKG
jgi:predicted nucleic acid-binding protein